MKTKYKKGLFALSGDPVTRGHLHVIELAKARCEVLVVLVANNDMKLGKYLFPLNERVEMLRRATTHLTGVEVVGSGHLLVDFFLEYGCDVLFRGIRDEKDKRYEIEQMAYHAMVYPPIVDMIEYIETGPEWIHVSSTLTKAFATHHLSTAGLTLPFVQSILEERLHGQFKLGVTGEVASGKTWVCYELWRSAQRAGYPVHLINIDLLIRDLYGEQSDGAQIVRERLTKLLGEHVLTDDRRYVERKAMAETLFSASTSKEVREEVERLTRLHIERLYRKALRGKRGLILVEWAQMAEMDMGSWTNNNVLIIESPDRESFAQERGLSAARLAHLAGLQWSTEEKARALEERAVRAEQGSVLRFMNHRDPARSAVAIQDLLSTITSDIFPTLEAS